MNYKILPLHEKYYPAMLAVFNHYVENSFAAYPENKAGLDVFSKLLASLGDYPSGVIMCGEDVAGFAFLRPYSPLSVFRKTAEITCFLAVGHTGKGAGALALSFLEGEAALRGITRILAGISGFNDGSMRFHGRHGFVECGRFRGIGLKFGREFDVVWMEKFLDSRA